METPCTHRVGSSSGSLAPARPAWRSRSRPHPRRACVGANDRVRVGIVGFSDRSRDALIPAFMKHAAELNFELVAVSDIWSRRREEGAAFIEKLTGTRPALCRNNDELYDRKDVDAVIIATADFQHALHGVEAVRAGRDAYVEKPMANTMADARAIRKAVKDTGTHRADRHAAPQLDEVSARVRLHQVRQVRRHRHGRDDVEREPARPLAAAEAGERAAGAGHRLEAFPHEPSARAVRRAEASRIPAVLAVFVGHPRPVDGPPDRYRALVRRICRVRAAWSPMAASISGRDGRTNFDTMTAVFDYGPLNDSTKGFQVVYSSRRRTRLATSRSCTSRTAA